MDIIITDLCKKYGEKQVLNHFSCEIKKGVFTCIMAPSGEGKTTLLRILAGLEKADSGSLQGMEDMRISMVFQEDRLCGNLSAIDNVKLVCGRDMPQEQIIRELQAVGLAGSERQPVSGLSGGMRRRTALVRALMASYDMLILDEPFIGLDEENKRKIMDYTKLKCRGKTVLLVTHDEEEAEYMGCSRLSLAGGPKEFLDI